MFLKTLRVAALLGSLVLSAQAALTWDNPVQSFEFLPDKKSVEVHFAFKNTGTNTVTIKDLKTTCGCTTAKLDKRTYAPGESGEVIATYSFHMRTGPLRKLVNVWMDDSDKPAVLDIRVLVREPFVVKPSLVYWKVDAPTETKTVSMVADKFDVAVKDVSCSDPRVEVKLTTVRPGFEYQLQVTPKATNEKVTAEITVKTDYPANEPREYKIYARVK